MYNEEMIEIDIPAGVEDGMQMRDFVYPRRLIRDRHIGWNWQRPRADSHLGGLPFRFQAEGIAPTGCRTPLTKRPTLSS